MKRFVCSVSSCSFYCYFWSLLLSLLLTVNPNYASAFTIPPTQRSDAIIPITINNQNQNNHNRIKHHSPFALYSATEDATTRQVDLQQQQPSHQPQSHPQSDHIDNDLVQTILQALEKRLGKSSIKSSSGAFSHATNSCTAQVLSEPETTATVLASDFLLHQLSVQTTRATKAVPTTTTNTNIDPKQLQAELHTAVSQLNATAVSLLLQAGAIMDETLTHTAFWSVVQAVDDAEANDVPLSADIPRMLHHVFDADLNLLFQRDTAHRTNLTCMQPASDESMAGSARRMNYIFDDSAHKHLPLMEGRRCEDGQCCQACSRNIFTNFLLEQEVNFDLFPQLQSFTFNDLTSVPAATILQFARMVERVRRTIGHEYGLNLQTLLPLQAYSRKYVAGTTQQGGGGGEGDFVTLHTDEATHSGYHYSCVLYLSTHGVDFQGGAFVFNDPCPPNEAETTSHSNDTEDDDYDNGPVWSLEEEIRRAGRTLTPFLPTRGSAVIFSSGWENMHEVERITHGTRYTVPCFFTTCPVPELAYEQMVVGKPKCDEDIADDWLHLLLAHRQETPQEAVGRVKELLMKWHYMCTPLSEH